MSDVIEYQRLRIEALTAELERVNLLLLDFSNVATQKAKDIKVIIDYTACEKPLSELNRNYGIE